MAQVKGLSTALKVAVIAIVLLIVAIIILTIFNISLGGIMTLVQANNYCEGIGQTACNTGGTLPFNWGLTSVQTDQGWMSCQSVINECASCQECGFI